jgi:hypothetical protein
MLQQPTVHLWALKHPTHTGVHLWALKVFNGRNGSVSSEYSLHRAHLRALQYPYSTFVWEIWNTIYMYIFVSSEKVIRGLWDFQHTRSTTRKQSSDAHI